MWQERLNEFVTLFIVVNPIGVLPFFLGVTRKVTAGDQRMIAFNAVLTAFGVLLFFMIAGGFVLEKLGISLTAFQIAGGIVLFLVALEMVRGGAGRAPEADGDPMSLAVYPIAIPKIAGPATMLTVVLLTDDHRFDIVQLTMTAGVLVVVLAIQLGILLAAGPVSRLIGRAGMSVIARVMGMFLIALAVHTILSALGPWLHLPKL